jgi:hypothetical protein
LHQAQGDYHVGLPFNYGFVQLFNFDGFKVSKASMSVIRAITVTPRPNKRFDKRKNKNERRRFAKQQLNHEFAKVLSALPFQIASIG